MITLSLFLVFAGFFVLYQASRKAGFESNLALILWFRKQRINAKETGIVLLLVALFLSTEIWGLGAGVLFFFIQCMTLASLIILLIPLKVISYKYVLSLATLLLLLEIFKF